MDSTVRIESFNQKDGTLWVILPCHPCVSNAHCQFSIERYAANSYNIVPIQGLAGCLKGIEYAYLIHLIFSLIPDAKTLTYFLHYGPGYAYSYDINKSINNNPCDYYEPILKAITVDIDNPHHGETRVGKSWEIQAAM